MSRWKWSRSRGHLSVAEAKFRFRCLNIYADEVEIPHRSPLTLCVEFKTGAIKWEERSKSLSWLAADGRLYAHADDGTVLLAVDGFGIPCSRHQKCNTLAEFHVELRALGCPQQRKPATLSAFRYDEVRLQGRIVVNDACRPQF